ncbi:hypothetical protein [Actinomadura soli]|uniref:hypothetical protein n=1 Tax=Actinomadura soli TaxID=2508997 RepID=UPI00197AD25B|nr:hypothetical protein [Actinomadura soli]
MIGGLWRLPLLRLDVGALHRFGGDIGIGAATGAVAAADDDIALSLNQKGDA